MNRTTKRMIIDRRMGDYTRGRHMRDYGHGEYEAEIRGDFETDCARTGRRRRDYAYDDYDMRDGRRGVKGTGRYGIGGSMHYPRRDRAMYDEYDDYAPYDYAVEEPMHLTREEMAEWENTMENANGTSGKHFTLTQVKQAAQAIGMNMRDFNEKELCLTVNSLYSDYCDALKTYIPRDKEAMAYTKMAKAFLEDPDASVMGAEKLAAYFYAIVSDK